MKAAAGTLDGIVDTVSGALPPRQFRFWVWGGRACTRPPTPMRASPHLFPPSTATRGLGTCRPLPPPLLLATAALPLLTTAARLRLPPTCAQPSTTWAPTSRC